MNKRYMKKLSGSTFVAVAILIMYLWLLIGNISKDVIKEKYRITVYSIL
jgi:hypothetical protein